MLTLDLLGGTHVRDAIREAVDSAIDGSVRFVHNDRELVVSPGWTYGEACAEWERLHGDPVLTPEQERQNAADELARMESEHAAAIASAGVATEEELREQDVPWPASIDELTAYITSLAKRPHDYGTCVYAASMAAVAAFYYVLGTLGMTGFQAGCAEMDFIRRTRRLKHGFRILDLGNLLYPQNCNAEHFPSWEDCLRNKDVAAALAKAARKNLDENPHAAPEVRNHWGFLVDNGMATEPAEE